MNGLPAVAPTAVAREIGRTLTLLTKAARARRIYQAGNAALVRIQRDLFVSIDQLLTKVDFIDLRIRPAGLYFDDICVLDAPNPDDSLAFAFYRDGIRRLAFHRGVTKEEVEVLVAAAASGFTYTGLGEDTVTYLWRHDLDHIQYLVVDTTIVDATELPEGQTRSEGPSRSAAELDGAIDSLLRRIYGDSAEDVAITSFSLDRSDIAAKQIAETLDNVDEMAPGFHPLRAFNVTPAYSREVLGELDREDDHRVGLRAAHAVLHSVRAQVSGSPESRRLFEVLLKMYDAAIIDENLRLASYVLAGVTRCPGTQERSSWLREALAETRLRQVAQDVAASTNRDIHGLIAFFRACGRPAVGTILAVLTAFQEPSERRALSDLVLELGLGELDRLRELLHGDQAFLAQEAIYILSRLESPDSANVLREAEHHPAPQVRIALLDSARLLGPRDAVELAARLLEDDEPRVRVMAARALARAPSRGVINLLEQRTQRPDFDEEESDVKVAILAGYALASQSRALPIIARLVKRGEGLLASKKAEDTAIQALRAIRGVKGAPRMLDILNRAAQSRKKRIRETATAVLQDLRGQA